nr:hypothetical protein [Anaerosoma tenue]
MHERPADQRPPRLAGRQRVHRAVGEIGDAEVVEQLSGPRLHLRRDLAGPVQPYRSEESRQHHVAHGQPPAVLLLQGVRDHSEDASRREQVPERCASHEHRGLVAHEGTDVAGEQADERGLARAVGAEHRNVFAFAECETVDMEDRASVAYDLRVTQIDEDVRCHATPGRSL